MLMTIAFLTRGNGQEKPPAKPKSQTPREKAAEQIAEPDRRRAEEQLIDAIEAISEGFVLFDRDDRYLLTNTKYREMYPELGDMFAPGTPYETMLRTGIERRVWVIDGDPEEWIR